METIYINNDYYKVDGVTINFLVTAEKAIITNDKILIEVDVQELKKNTQKLNIGGQSLPMILKAICYGK